MNQQNKETKSSVDFSNYNPYYKDVSEYIKACNKARLMFKESRDLEPYYTAIDILTNTVYPYVKNKYIEILEDEKKVKKQILNVLDDIGDFMPKYRIMKKRVHKPNVPNTLKEKFIIKEHEILSTLSKIQRNVIKDLSYFKILPRVSIEYQEDEDDGLAYN